MLAFCYCCFPYGELSFVSAYNNTFNTVRMTVFHHYSVLTLMTLLRPFTEYRSYNTCYSKLISDARMAQKLTGQGSKRM